MSEALVHLEIQTADPAAEIFLLDAELHLVRQSVGGLVSDERPGLYQVKVRVGDRFHEELIALRGGSVRKDYGFLGFSSPFPLQNTLKTHEYHLANSESHSHVVHAQAGAGAFIYVFARDWTGPGAGTAPQPRPHPARGLSVARLNGEQIVDLEAASAKDLSGDPWAACNIAIDPGAWILRCRLPDGSVQERTIVASPGWQAQCFLLQAGSTEQPWPDLPGASVAYRPAGSGFSPADVQFRLVELARIALAQRRPLVTGELERVLRAKFENPMLGLLGAHLLLLQQHTREKSERASAHKFDPHLLAEIVGHLRSLLVAPHPDVEALACRAGIGIGGYRFDSPPMLRDSWSLITAASATEAALIPEDSLTFRIAARVVTAAPWLTWLGDDDTTSEEEDKEAVIECIALQMSGRTKPAAEMESFGLESLTNPSAGASEGGPNVEDLTRQLGLPRGMVERHLSQAIDRADKLVRERETRRSQRREPPR